MDCSLNTISWKSNIHCQLINNMSADELDLFEADIADAISGVLEDWEGR
jgi:hypothetical protein